MSDRLLTVTQLAAQWGWPRTRVWRLVQRGRIACVRYGRAYFIRESQAAAWIAAEETATAGSTQPAASAPPLRKSIEQEAKDWGLEPDELLH